MSITPKSSPEDFGVFLIRYYSCFLYRYSLHSQRHIYLLKTEGFFSPHPHSPANVSIENLAPKRNPLMKLSVTLKLVNSRYLSA